MQGPTRRDGAPRDDGTASFDSLYGADLGEGALVGAWRIERLCDKGGFGAVYRAHDPGGRAAAIKVLHRALVHSSTGLARFEAEADAMRRVRHPALVELLDAGSLTDGRPYLAMEWVDGETLERRLRAGGRLSASAALALMEPLCAGVEAVHAAGIVHRDLKCSNVMLPATGGVKILDFGIAKRLDETVGLTVTGARVGTPSSMAPEQILGRTVGPATDVYALGVVLFELLTGRLPFTATTAAALERLHVTSDPPRASDICDVGAAVADVVARALAKSPYDRPAGPRELLTELSAAVQDAPASRGALRVEKIRGVAVHLSSPAGVRWADHEVPLREHGFHLAATGAGWLLAVATLPDSPSRAADVRSRALQLALRTAEIAADPALAIQVHAGAVRRLFVRGMPQFVGDELVGGAWLVRSPPPGVHATPAALDGIENRFEVDPATRRVTGARKPP